MKLKMLESRNLILSIEITRKEMGNQRPNVSKYARSVSNGFLCALEARLANLELT